MTPIEAEGDACLASVESAPSPLGQIDRDLALRAFASNVDVDVEREVSTDSFLLAEDGGERVQAQVRRGGLDHERTRTALEAHVQRLSHSVHRDVRGCDGSALDP